MDSIVQALAEQAKRVPDRAAVIADDERMSYRELWEEVQGFAAFLREKGFPRGARVVVKSAPSLWFPVACLGIHLAGYVHVPLEKTIGPEGMAGIAQELEASFLIADLDMDESLRKAGLAAACFPSARVREEARRTYREGLSFAFPEPEDPCDILFTTGTTGKSKGVIEPHRAVVAVAENVQYGAEIPEDNVYLIPAPINHASAIRKLYVSVLTGTTAVLLDGFTDVKRFFSCIEKYHVTSILMPPAAVRMMLLLAEKSLAKCAGQLHHIHTGSAAFPEADKEKLCQILPDTRLYFAYGSSEAGCVAMYDYSRNRGLISCVGKPNRNAHIFIVDEEGNSIESSKEHQGLIAISGPVLMAGYYHAPELTREVMRDGVVYTNDIGYIDEQGFVYVLGRRGDVISIGGLKIAPTEVENVVLRYPSVADCACFAVEDRMGGKVPRLNVVLRKGETLDAAALRAFMGQHLEAFKIPKTIQVVDELPRTANGKLDRKRLK